MDLQYFGNIEDLGSDLIEKEISIDGKNVKLILNLQENFTSPHLSFALDSLMKYERLITNVVRQHKGDKDTNWGKKIHYYTNHHAMDLTAEELAELLDNDSDTSLSIEMQLVDALYIYSIEFVQNHIYWNYTIGENFSNYLLSIKTDYDLNIKDIQTTLLVV